MTVVFGMTDSDAERRAKVMGRIEQRVLERSVPATLWAAGSTSVLVGASRGTPVDFASHPSGSALVVGRVTGRSSPAQWAVEQSATHGPRAVNGHSGLYLACHIGQDGCVTLATDVLGFFPLYVWSDQRVLLFSTEPSLIHEHPFVSRRMSAEGLIGILLLGHMANGQTLWEGIGRPEPGEVFQWWRGDGGSTRLANALVPSEQWFEVPYVDARKRMSEALECAVASSVSAGQQALMLSGGLDSRLIAGCLAKLAPGRTTAFTFGEDNDIEMQCARAVSDELEIHFKQVPICFDDFLLWMKQCVEREQLSNTLFDFGWPSAAGSVEFGERDLINGFCGDAVMGGSWIKYAYDPKRGLYRFEQLLKESCKWGLSPEVLSDVLAVDSAARRVRDVIEKLRTRFDSIPGYPFQKAWMWALIYRNRFHVVPYALRMADSAWPALPYCDRTVLELSGSMPLSYIASRRMQVDILKQDFPPLARLPLDRNSWDSRPLEPTLGYRVKNQFAKVRQRFIRSTDERRAYHRIFNINNAGWRSIRKAVDPLRPAAREIFVPGALDRLLPSAGAQVVTRNGIRDVSSMKTLCALLILLSESS